MLTEKEKFIQDAMNYEGSSRKDATLAWYGYNKIQARLRNSDSNTAVATDSNVKGDKA